MILVVLIVVDLKNVPIIEIYVGHIAYGEYTK